MSTSTKSAGRRTSISERRQAKQQERLRKMRAKAGNRYRIHYDIDGPRIRLGILWFFVAMGAFLGGEVGVVACFGVAFAAAASHTLRTWRARGAPVDPRLALGGTALAVVAAGFGPKVLGIAIILLAVGAVGVSVAGLDPDDAPVRAFVEAGLLLQASLPTALAGGCLVLLADVETWSAVSLILLCSAYETGDYLIGSGAANPVEGPLAGGVAVLVLTLAITALGFLPFSQSESLVVGIAVFPCAVLGQLLGSVMLPHSRAYAPALRRVDSYLVAAPLWYLATAVL